MQFDERTPAPMDPRQVTGAISMTPPQQQNGSFGEWWKQLVAICIGLAAVGLVLAAVGRQFFVTREEWNAFREATFNMDAKNREYHQKIDDAKRRIDDLQKDVDQIKIRFVEMDARSTPRRPR